MWLKICGVTSEAAVEAALEAGVDAIGFVFAPSVREIAPARAAQLAAPARGRAELIAVTLHPDQARLNEILSVFRPDVLQTDAADFGQLVLPHSLLRLPVLRGDAGPAAVVPPQRVLFEGPRSGSGQPGDWVQAARLAAAGPVVLAGGLNADNVAVAIRQVRPFGVDTSSGVESAPGIKSPERIYQFVSAARAAFQEINA